MMIVLHTRMLVMREKNNHEFNMENLEEKHQRADEEDEQEAAS